MRFVGPSKGNGQDCATAMGQLDDRQRCTAVVDLTKGTSPGLMKGIGGMVWGPHIPWGSLGLGFIEHGVPV